jgi:acyl-CoA thioesterase-2
MALISAICSFFLSIREQIQIMRRCKATDVQKGKSPQITYLVYRADGQTWGRSIGLTTANCGQVALELMAIAGGLDCSCNAGLSVFMESNMAQDISSFVALTSTGENTFQAGANEANFNGEIFGGQYLGQSLWAAMSTVAEDRGPHSLYGYFLRAARADRPLDFVVERTRDGRGFSHRRVTAWQAEQEVFRAEISFCVPQTGQPNHQFPMPAAAAAEGLASLETMARENIGLIGQVGAAKLAKKHLFEVRPVSPMIGISAKSETPHAMFWVRPVRPVPPEAIFLYSALAYLTDVMANFACRTTHVGNVYDGSLSSLSLNHGIWFYRRPAALEWMLFVLDSPSASQGLGANRGLIYDAEGALIAGVVQDALVMYR